MITHQGDSPVAEQLPRVPAVVYSRLHRRLLDAIESGVVVFYDPAKCHLIGGYRGVRGIELGLARLAFAGYTEFATVAAEGKRPVLLTPLGDAAKRRWDNELGLVERSGGES